MIGRIDLRPYDIAGFEVDELIGARADGLKIGGRIARFVALIGLKQVLGDDHSARADEGIGPEGRGLLELHLDRVIVDLLDLNVLVGRDIIVRGGRVAGVLPVEDAVVGGEGLPVMPLHTLFQFPGDGFAVV